jgi:predicted alpha/beta hydrolase family esterase
VKPKIIFVHCAGSQEPPHGSSGLVEHLRQGIGAEYDLLAPQLEDAENPSYARWRERLADQIASVDQPEVILIGHSLGASVLLKFFSEEKKLPKVSAMFLIAAPFWGLDEEWQNNEYVLKENFQHAFSDQPPVFLYHSKEDAVVPLIHAQTYKRKLSWANTREIEGSDHYFTSGLPQLMKDIVHISISKDDVDENQ